MSLEEERGRVFRVLEKIKETREIEGWETAGAIRGSELSSSERNVLADHVRNLISTVGLAMAMDPTVALALQVMINGVIWSHNETSKEAGAGQTTQQRLGTVVN